MSLFKNLKSDLLSSLVVFLVALPLSLGVALASGAPIEAGVIAAVIGGVVVGLFGGAPLQVSGPAAGLTIMVLGFIQTFGFHATCVITLLAGVFQIVLGFLGVGQLTLAISPSVIEAMLAGIGVLIALSQTYVLMGANPKGSALANLAHLPETFMTRNHQAFLLGVFTLVVLWAWQKWVGKKFKLIPSSLIAVVLGTVVSQILDLEIPRVTIDAHIVQSLHFTSFVFSDLPKYLLSAVAMTIVASAESLLCAVATDKLHTGPRARLNQELIGQGFANFISGFCGGLPVTGVIVRSSANVNAGAKSKLSAILHGVWLLVFVSFMANYLSYIPLSVLAALLIFTGVNLVKLHEIKKLMAFNEALIYFVTITGVVFINLLWGIALGFALAVVVLLYRLSHFEVQLVEDDGSPKHLVISGSLTFLGIPSLIRQLDALPQGETLLMVLDIDHLDHASLEALRSWKENYEKTGGKIIKTPLEELWKNLSKGLTEVRETSYKVPRAPSTTLIEGRLDHEI